MYIMCHSEKLLGKKGIYKETMLKLSPFFLSIINNYASTFVLNMPKSSSYEKATPFTLMHTQLFLLIGIR